MIPFTDAMLNVFSGVTPAELGCLIYLDFDSDKGSKGGPVRLSTFGYPTLTWDPPDPYVGDTWFGLARITSMGEIRWSSDSANTPMSLVLGAADPFRLNDALNASRQRYMTMWLAAYTLGASPVIVSTPRIILKRRMYPQSASSKELTVTIGLEALFNRTRARAIRKRSNADQRLIDASDESLVDASQGTLGSDTQTWKQKSGM